MEMARNGGAQSGRLNGWMLSHCVAVAVLDEKGAHFTNGREEAAECFILQ